MCHKVILTHVTRIHTLAQTQTPALLTQLNAHILL